MNHTQLICYALGFLGGATALVLWLLISYASGRARNGRRSLP